jgi:hypothetical protein
MRSDAYFMDSLNASSSLASYHQPPGEHSRNGGGRKAGGVQFRRK